MGPVRSESTNRNLGGEREAGRCFFVVTIGSHPGLGVRVKWLAARVGAGRRWFIPMKSPLIPLLPVLALVAVSACSKPSPKAAEPAPAPAQPQGRSWSEAMGVASDDQGYAGAPPASGNGAAASAAPVRRTLTSSDGRKLEALLLSRTETSVKVRRLSDSTEFVIPLDKLSAADRDFIRQSGIPTTP